MRNIILAVLTVLTMNSCAVYSKFQTPTESLIVDSLYNYIEATNDSTTIASLSWRELFTDEYLQQLIEQGLERNVDMNVARLNIEQAEIALRTARLSYLPSLSIAASDNMLKGSSPTYDLSFSASWEIDLFGKIRNSKVRERAALEQSKVYRQSIQTGLIATISNSYYTLLMLDEQLTISKQTVDIWSKNIRSMEVLMSAGRINKTSVLQSEANKVALESSIVDIEKQIASMEGSLSALLMQPTCHIERGSLNSISFPQDISIGVPLQLVSNRPDIKVAEYNLAQAFYNVNYARASMYPSITLSGSAGFLDGSGAILNPSEFIFGAIGSIVQPLFNKGALRGQLEISKSQQEQAQLQFTQSIIDAATEVNDALIEWQSANKNLGYDLRQIELLEDAVKSSEALMRSGQINYLEVLTAQITLLQAELSLSNNRFSEIQGIINLYKALGGGCE